MKAGNQTLLKKNNQRALADYIIKNGPMSRADLSKRLKISKPTVSANIAELIEMNLLKEIGFSETEIGKKPMLVDFNKDFEYILALDFISYITKNIVLVAVCNLYCDPIFTDSIDLGEDFSAHSITNTLPETLLKIFDSQNISMDKIGVIVLTAPTNSYDESHVRLVCGNGDIVNLAQSISTTLKNKILVQNDINLAALGEKYFGVGKKVDNLVFVWAGLATGGGLILSGELYEGCSKSGGELAYSNVYDEITNEYAFLQDLLSLKGVRAYIEFHKQEALESSISDKLFSKKLSIDDMITASYDGDEFCIEFAKCMGNKIAIVICNLCLTLDLEMAIIGGEYSRFGHIVINEINKRLEVNPITNTLITTPMYGNSAMYGAFKIGADYIIANMI